MRARKEFATHANFVEESSNPNVWFEPDRQIN